jgi:hypothetical protein
MKRLLFTTAAGCILLVMSLGCADQPVSVPHNFPEPPSVNGIGWVGGGGRAPSDSTTTQGAPTATPPDTAVSGD